MAFIHSVLFCETFSLFTAVQLLISIWTNLLAHMEMIGIVAKIGTISKALDKLSIQS